MKKAVCFLFPLLFTFGSAFSQDYAIERGAILASGMVEYSSKSGDMYEGHYFHRSTEFALNATFDYFVESRIFAGARTTLTRRVEGDEWKTDGIGGGPEVGFALGNAKSQLFPYAKIGYQYLAMHSEYSETSKSDAVQTDIIYSAGIIVPVKKHFGITCEFSYHLQSEKHDGADESIKGNILRFGIGLTGLFF